MEDGEVEELYQYYDNFSKSELVDQILTIILIHKEESSDSNLLDDLVDEYVKNYESELTDKNGNVLDEDKRIAKITNIANKKYGQYNRKKLIRATQEYEYQKHSNMKKKELVELMVEEANNKKVIEYQYKVLKKVGNNKMISLKKLDKSKSTELLKNGDNNMVYKYKNKILKYEGYDPKQLGSFNNGANEIFVSKFATNKYSGFAAINAAKLSTPCPEPIDMYKYCSLIDEEFLEGIAISDWVYENSDSEDFEINLYNILLKIFKFLSKIHKENGFTHYDLHNENVIIDGKNEPKIIDYGFSYIRYDNKNCGGMSIEGAIYNRPMWSHDVFKLLFFIIRDIVYINKKLNKGKSIKTVYFENILELLQKSLNLFLEQISLSLRLFKTDELAYKSITIEKYLDKYNAYSAPTKEIQDANNLTFDEFMKIFKSYGKEL